MAVRKGPGGIQSVSSRSGHGNTITVIKKSGPWHILAYLDIFCLHFCTIPSKIMHVFFVQRYSSEGVLPYGNMTGA